MTVWVLTAIIWLNPSTDDVERMLGGFNVTIQIYKEVSACQKELEKIQTRDKWCHQYPVE